MVSDKLNFALMGSPAEGLNPCSNGIWSLTGLRLRLGLRLRVLILVLMEYGL